MPVYWVEGGHTRTFSSRSPMGGQIGAAVNDDRVGLTAKVREAVSEVLSRQGFDYLFVADDDTFVHVGRWLAHSPSGDIECRAHKPKDLLSKKANKGKPYVTGGPGWHMSRQMCELFVDQCHRYGHSNDDVVVARVADANNIIMVNRLDLYGADRYTGMQDRVGPGNALMTCHDVTPREMMELFYENYTDDSLVRRAARAASCRVGALLESESISLR